MFVWSAFICFFLAYCIRAFRLWWIIKPIKFSFLQVVFSIVLGSAIALFSSSVWFGELLKWFFLGFIFSLYAMPVFVSLVYIHLFDFFALAIAMTCFISGLPVLWPWVGFAFCLGLLILGFLMVGTLYNERLSVYIQNRWNRKRVVKFLLPLLASKSSIIKLKLFEFKTCLITGVFSVLIWFFEGLGFYFVLSTFQYPMVREGVARGFLHIVGSYVWFYNSCFVHSSAVVQQMCYESYEVPLFVAVFIFSVIALRLWVFPRKNLNA